MKKSCFACNFAMFAPQFNQRKSMRKFQLIGYVVILIITGVSCQQKKSGEFVTYRDFPREVSIQGHTVELDTAIFKYPYTINITNGKAIVHDLHNADNYFICSIIRNLPMRALLAGAVRVPGKW